MADDGFHEGELRVQQQAGVAAQAQRLAGMLTAGHLSDGMSLFIAERELAFVTAEDEDGRLWTSPISGPRGFCQGHDRSFTVAGAVPEGDPLQGLRAGRRIGLLLVDFARRRRLRVNGVLTASAPDGLEVSVEQAFGNCPRYISPRDLGALPARRDRSVGHADRLEPGHLAQIVAADMFVLGTIHPERGADTSHRGGEPGFVHGEDGRLWWPDHPGNNLFNTLGNIVVNPAASLLFMDGERRTTLQLSGRADVEWTPDEETGRRVWFTPERVVASRPAE